MANVASSSLTFYDRTVFGNKLVALCSYTPSTAAGSDTVFVGFKVDTVTGSWSGTTAPDAACVVVFGKSTNGVVVANTTHANHPVTFTAIGHD